MKGTLYIVSTPIGNLEDITLRALRILKEVDVIAAEDTRHSRKLLSHYGISKPLMSYWGEREKVKSEEVIEVLRSGRSVALVTDAGTPGISDPGGVLIRRAVDEEIPLVPVPGPTALVAALSLSGFSSDRFVFCGFLPATRGARRKELERLSLEERTMVLYEAPHRIVETMADMRELFGDERRAVVVKEITKLYEEIYRGRLEEIALRLAGLKIAGEYVVVVEGRPQALSVNPEQALREVRELMKKGLRRKDAVKKVAGDYGMSRKDLYDRSLEEG